MEVVAMDRGHQDSSRRKVIVSIVLIVIAYVAWLCGGHLIAPPIHQGEAFSEVVADTLHHEAHDPPGAPAFFSVLPFGVLLLCIALLPLFHKSAHWWERNSNKFIIAGALAMVTLLYYALIHEHDVHNHQLGKLSPAGWSAAIAVLQNAILADYIPFIVLLFSLYVLCGGVSIEGHMVGRPKLNVTILAIGGLLASLMGTTGAAMLLIRPLLKANAKRRLVAHTVVFFIFIVCNTGGCLLPIGDPPLFLGYLSGVPFFWTLQLTPQWLFMNVALLAVYFVWDTVNYRREDRAAVEAVPDHPEPFGIRGTANFLWLAGVIACVVLFDPAKTFPGTTWHAPLYFREVALLGFTALSLFSTTTEIRLKNSFNYDAIQEVAILFVGIFICMQVPIQILHVHGSALGIDQPWKYYWITGALSSFLDNAPTYIVFFETAKSSLHPLGDVVAGVPVKELAAISLGAVFMGSMTYIGNGPNFMVKAIAEKNQIKMPSFFGYMAYSCAVVLPISVIMTMIFLK